MLILLLVWFIYRWPEALRAVITQRSVYLTLLIGVILKTIPFIDASTIQNGKALYFSSISRSYEETVLLEDISHKGLKTTQIATWLNSSTLPNESILLVNFGKGDRYRLQALTGRHFYTLDLFSICALGCFYNKMLYLDTKQYFENTIGIGWDTQFLSLDRDARQQVINNSLPGIIEGDLLQTIDGRRPKFIVSNAMRFEKPMVYSSQDYYVYQYK